MADQQLHPTNTFDLEPEVFRRMGYAMVDLMSEVIQAESSDPVLPPAGGAQMRAVLDEPVPDKGLPFDTLLDEIRQRLLPHNRRNGHPRFFAYVSASADPIGALADALISIMNQNVTTWRSAPGATELERTVLRWLDEMLGFEGGGHGLMVGGGSAANATGIASALARATFIEDDPNDQRPRRLTVYIATEGHLSLVKAARLYGVAGQRIRRIAVDAQRRMDVDALDRQIRNDKEAGLVPACVCASAGTANTGVIDPLDQIADVCRDQGVWLHIDGAYGALAALTSGYAWLRSAFARADSISIDPHKWLYAPLDVGCVLIRDEEASRRAFSLDSEYVRVTQTDPIEQHAFFDHGMELSRRFRAFKVWMILKARGVDQITGMIERNIRTRIYLDDRIEREERLELLGSELSISCFRFLPPGSVDEAAVSALNERILQQIAKEGRALMSPTTLEGRYSLRVCIVNFRTTEADMDLLIDEVLRLGEALA